MQSIFQAYKLNQLLTLKNRVVMAPMTRAKATDNFVPTADMAAYYARRADAGLIVTEGTIISADARGYNNVPGIFTQAQIAGWQQVTRAVHERGGLIFMQIWHVGRVSHPTFLNGNLPVSASATTMKGHVSRSDNLQYGQSRELSLAEIKPLIDRFRVAAENAIKAGMDGIEIHAANGYLIDQFLHYDTNHRQDQYGGNAENMARFALEIIKACGEAIGYERVAIRLSPGAYLNEIVGDKKDAHVFQYLLQQLNQLPIAYVHTGNFNDKEIFAELNHQTMTAFMRQYYQGTLIASGGYDIAGANDAIDNHAFDLVAIGRPFIANPDFITRIQTQQTLQAYDRAMLETLY